MNVTRSDVLAIHSEYDIVLARQTARTLCQELNFSLVEVTKMVTAASEIARNTLDPWEGRRRCDGNWWRRTVVQGCDSFSKTPVLGLPISGSP